MYVVSLRRVQADNEVRAAKPADRTEESAMTTDADIKLHECEAYRPGTMGYQFCWLPEGHAGPHRCQGYPMYSDWTSEGKG